MNETPAAPQPLSCIQYDLEINIEAKKDAVWHALTQEINSWWLADFHMLGADSSLSLDAVAGGYLLERDPRGSSLLWYTVQMCQQAEALHLVGHISPDFGGPATTMLTLRLEEKNGGTNLKIRDALFGQISSSTADCLEIGWAQLFGVGLKKYVENHSG